MSEARSGDVPAGVGGGARVALLCTAGRATNVLYHALTARFGNVAVIEETPIARSELVRRRVRRLGVRRVAGQLAFQVGIAPVLARLGAGRVAQVLSAAGLSDAPIPEPVIRRVPTVNGADAHAALREIAPSIVVISGTRILGAATLAAVPARFVNVHAGITPAYRGVHGAFWALAEGRADLAGVTVHFVDTGIDTGSVITHARIAPTAADGFATYPMLQVAAGVPPLLDAVGALLEGREPARSVIPNAHAPLRYHPTVAEYLLARMRGRVP